jgi:DNA end-binding protein Ku
VAQRRPYILLLEAMKQTGLGAVGKFVLWGKENLSLIRPLGESLVLETLFYAEDIRSRAEIEEAVEETDLAEAELAMAVQLVEGLSGDFDPEAYRNEYREELRAMLESKLAGEEITRPEPAAPVPVVDLMEALKKSVAQAKSEREPEKKKPARRKRAAAAS